MNDCGFVHSTCFFSPIINNFFINFCACFPISPLALYLKAIINHQVIPSSSSFKIKQINYEPILWLSFHRQILLPCESSTPKQPAMPFKLVDIVAIIAKAGAAAPFTNDMPVSLCEHCHGKLFLVLVNFSWFIGVHCEGC